jgi:hypothetical protein
MIELVRLQLTYKIAEHLAVAEPPCGDMVFEVPAVGRRVGSALARVRR